MLRKRSLFLLLFLPALFVLVSCGKSKDEEDATDNPTKTDVPIPDFYSPVNIDSLPPVSGVRSIKVNNIGALKTVFNDSNHVQLVWAQKLGIDPITDLSKAYFMKRPIVKVESNGYYHIDSLTHSVPYLVPEAARLLQDIGKNFIDSLYARGGDSYKIKVTSILRTSETVKNLKKVNINATDSSTHQYGTTFDISHSKFICLDSTRQINQGDLKNLLAEVLLDLRNQGRCLVKYEHKTACFHVTVTR